jgi:hypothetical protein
MASPDSFERALSIRQTQTCSDGSIGIVALGQGGHWTMPASTSGPGTNFVTGDASIGNAYRRNRNKELVPGTDQGYNRQPDSFVWSAVPQIFRVCLAPENPVSSLLVVIAVNTFDLLQRMTGVGVHGECSPFTQKSWFDLVNEHFLTAVRKNPIQEIECKESDMALGG